MQFYTQIEWIYRAKLSEMKFACFFLRNFHPFKKREDSDIERNG
jgi:hypothetical protein